MIRQAATADRMGSILFFMPAPPPHPSLRSPSVPFCAYIYNGMMAVPFTCSAVKTEKVTRQGGAWNIGKEEEDGRRMMEVKSTDRRPQYNSCPIGGQKLPFFDVRPALLQCRFSCHSIPRNTKPFIYGKILRKPAIPLDRRNLGFVPAERLKPTKTITCKRKTKISRES